MQAREIMQTLLDREFNVDYNYANRRKYFMNPGTENSLFGKHTSMYMGKVPNKEQPHQRVVHSTAWGLLWGGGRMLLAKKRNVYPGNLIMADKRQACLHYVG